MYKRDVGILMLAMAGIYLSIQHEGAFNFRKAWCAALGDLPVAWLLAELFWCNEQVWGRKVLGLGACCRYFHLDEDASILQPHDVLPYPVVVRVQASSLSRVVWRQDQDALHTATRHTQGLCCHKL